MRRCLAVLLLPLTATAVAHAHYVFVVPADGSQPLRVVVADGPTADPAVGVDVAAAGKFVAVDAAGRTRDLAAKPDGDGWLAFPDAPADAAEVRGTVEYGVVARGGPDPVLLVHHAKAVLTASKPGAAARPDPLPLELTPVPAAGGTAFRLTAGGRPLGSVDVLVHAPDEKRPRVVRTDADGLTPAFAQPGLYGARAYRAEESAGEFQGRAYKQVRRYATLTARVDGTK